MPMNSAQIKWFRNFGRRGALLAGLAAGLLAGVVLYAQEAAQPKGEAEAEASPPGEIRFVGKNRVATAKSVFHMWRIKSLNLDRENLANSLVEIEVDIESLDTGIERRDHHLRSADFFDIEKYPTGLIRVYDVQPKDGAESDLHLYVAQMDLTIRDITKTQQIEFEIVDFDSMAVRGEFVILRTDFGIGEPYKSFNPLSIEDEVKLSFDATLAPEA